MNLAAIGNRKWGSSLSGLQRLSERPWFYPAVLLFVGLVAYGYAFPSLGYYWDDWEVVFLMNARNPSLLYGYFAFDRPFAWPYQVMYALFGLNVLAWHVVTLLYRWAGILFLYLSLRMVWRRFDPYLRWLGVLLFVYPGFLQQSISGAYNRHFAAFALFGLSIYLMSLAVRYPARGWLLWPLSWVTAFVQCFTIEYFVGLELIRVLLLWLLIAQRSAAKRSAALGKAALLSVPYLLIVGFYFWWRLLVFPATIPRSNYAGDFKLMQDFASSFGGGLLTLLTRAVLDLIYATLQVWPGALSGSAGFTFQSKSAWFAVVTGVLIAALFGIFNKVGTASQTESEEERSDDTLTFFLFGLGAFLVSALPIWLTSRQLSGTGRWDDRFSLGTMLGAAMITLSLIMWLVRSRWQRPVLGALLALALITQILVVNRYRLEWTVQNAYYWQLAWRIPTLMPQTAIISLEQPSASVPGYDTSFALNVLFRGGVVGGAVPYWFFTNDRFTNFDFVPGKSISYRDRNLKFTGSTSDAISIVHQGEDRCLQVLDSAYTGQPFYTAAQEQLIGVSDVSRILPEAKVEAPDASIFGPEPPHTWCYYYQKADLARQEQDWDSIVRLEKQAKAHGFAPKFGPEFIPLIEANARTGNWRAALDLSRAADESIAEMQPLLCYTWTRLSTLPSVDPSVLGQAGQEFSCSIP